jgi:hypothetical protein
MAARRSKRRASSGVLRSICLMITSSMVGKERVEVDEEVEDEEEEEADDKPRVRFALSHALHPALVYRTPLWLCSKLLAARDMLCRVMRSDVMMVAAKNAR